MVGTDIPSLLLKTGFSWLYESLLALGLCPRLWLGELGNRHACTRSKPMVAIRNCLIESVRPYRDRSMFRIRQRRSALDPHSGLVLCGGEAEVGSEVGRDIQSCLRKAAISE